MKLRKNIKMKLKENIKRVLREFQFEPIRMESFRDGQLVLEMVTSDGPPKYMILYETGDFDDMSYDTTSDIIAEFESEFFDERMVQTIFDYLLTRE